MTSIVATKKGLEEKKIIKKKKGKEKSQSIEVTGLNIGASNP